MARLAGCRGQMGAMVRYLKAAFWASPDLPGLRNVPLNVIVLAALLLFGFVFPPLWIVAAVLEFLYLYGLASNERFRNLVDANLKHEEPIAAQERWTALVAQLSPPRQQRLRHLDEKCTTILQMEQSNREVSAESHEDLLQSIRWSFLKLLLAQQNLLAGHNAEGELKHQIQMIAAELQSPELVGNLREAKEATLSVLQSRLQNLEHRKQPLEQIEANLIRIEGVIDLAVESANLLGLEGIQTAGLNSLLSKSGIYGDSDASIRSLDAIFQVPPPLTSL